MTNPFDPSSLATRWNGRCPHCGHHRRLQGHAKDCPAGGCRKCDGRAWFNTRLCLFCLDKEKRASKELAKTGKP